MKTQMRFQKILMLITLIVAALSFVYALSFCGGTIYQYGALYNKVSDVERVAGVKALFEKTQGYNGTLVALSIVFIVITALNYITASNKRRNYYVTNYVSIILTAVYAVVFAVIIIAFIATTLPLFTAIDKDAAQLQYDMLYTDDFRYSLSNFILGFLMAALMIVNAVFLALNLVWKTRLMKGEKKLLEGAVSAEEVA